MNEPAERWCATCQLHLAVPGGETCAVCDPGLYRPPRNVRMQFDPDTPSDRLPDDVYQRGETTV